MEIHMSRFSISPETSLGPVHLTVSDLAQSVRFYGDILGLFSLPREGETARLGMGDGTVLLELSTDPEAVPRSSRSPGLYHFAVLLPSRGGLASFLRHVAERGYALHGASDHQVSEAIYLPDPDGNGIEVYSDRPRDEWRYRNGQLGMTTEPLDVEGLMAELEDPDHPWDGLPSGSRIGHVHLQVSNIEDAELFYSRLLGFDITQRYGSAAVFLSAGGYHHHIGLNTWRSAGAPPPPDRSLGMRYFTIVLPNREEMERLADRARRANIAWEERDDDVLLRDPSGIGVLLVG
jgi:catechol 2,3-dioxygenase